MRGRVGEWENGRMGERAECGRSDGVTRRGQVLRPGVLLNRRDSQRGLAAFRATQSVPRAGERSPRSAVGQLAVRRPRLAIVVPQS